MLKLTRKIEYALISLSHLQQTDKLSSAKEISETYSIPQEALAKGLQQLVKLNILEAIQGSHGGYQLKTQLKNINLMEFIEKIEGPIGLVDCNIDADCSLLEYCNIRKPIRRINENLKNMFSNINLSDITQ